ncbi:hypothetical protein AAG906_005305 [Vitis piasezkii]
MASGSSIMGRDPCWKYCIPMERNKNGTECNYSRLAIKSGGITRFQFHLSHTGPNSNTKKCPNVPPEVKQEIRRLLEQKIRQKRRKLRHRHVTDEDDEENLGGDDDDVYMYSTDMHPNERHAYREAIRASKAAKWNRQQEEHFVKGKRKISESSHPTNPTRQMQKSQSVRYSDPSLPDAPSLYKSLAARQKNMKNLFKCGAIKETMGRLISKFFIYESVPPSKANSHHFKNMIVGAQQAVSYEIKHKYLDMEYKNMEAYVHIQREKWKAYGCTIMCDRWIGPMKLSIINFMVYSEGSTIFLKSVDASNNIKDNKYIYGLLKDVIKEVGKQNVVQIVIDNGSAFTLCATHCIDLMFEDIGKRTSVADVITKARKITNFIYNHSWLLAQMQKVCGGDIVRPGATRFATNYIALDSLLKKKANLKKVFISDEWAQHNLSRTLIGKEVEKLMFDHAYWERLGKSCSYNTICVRIDLSYEREPHST